MSGWRLKLGVTYRQHIAFVDTKESFSSWRLTFLLVTNQLSLNCSWRLTFLLATIVVDAYIAS